MKRSETTLHCTWRQVLTVTAIAALALHPAALAAPDFEDLPLGLVPIGH